MAFDRLGTADLTNLAVEAADTPMHVGVLAVLDGSALLDGRGGVRLAEIRTALDARLDRVPVLRRVVHRPGPLAGRPLWVDDPTFRIDRHVSQVFLAAPAGADELYALTERLLESRLDRSRPLWRMWLVAGLPDDRVAVLVKLHHAIADGLAAVALLATLLDPAEPVGPAEPGEPVGPAERGEPVGPAEPAERAAPPVDGARSGGTAGDRPARWRPAPVPSWSELARDNLAGRLAGLARGNPAGRIAHRSAVLVPRTDKRSAVPVPRTDKRSALWSLRAGWHTVRRAWGAPRTSLNGPIGPHRRLGVVRLDLGAAREVAHRHRGKVNDVVLDVVAGGLRALLLARGEPVDGLALHVAVAVSLRTPADAQRTGNISGGIVVRLPLGDPDPVRRLDAIRAETAAAKRDQFAGHEQRFIWWLARSGVVRPFTRHQRLTNVVESNVTGPRQPIRVLGSTVLDLVPIGLIAGNLAITFLAFSYTGRLTVTVWADADRYPDLPLLLDAMRQDWARLRQS